MGDPKIVCTVEPKTQLLKYLNENFDELGSITISQGYYFQIRIKKETFESLPLEIRDTLRKHSNADDQLGNAFKSGSEEKRLWLETNYWSWCDAYLFNVEIEDAYWLNYNCIYGYEGLSESDSIVFVNNATVPTIVWENRGTSERLENFAVHQEPRIASDVEEN